MFQKFHLKHYLNLLSLAPLKKKKWMYDNKFQRKEFLMFFFSGHFSKPVVHDKNEH